MSSSCAAVRAHTTVDIHSSVPLRDARQQHDRHSKGPELRAAFEQALASAGGGQLVACASPPFPLPRKHTINIFTSLPSLPSPADEKLPCFLWREPRPVDFFVHSVTLPDFNSTCTLRNHDHERLMKWKKSGPRTRVDASKKSKTGAEEDVWVQVGGAFLRRGPPARFSAPRRAFHLFTPPLPSHRSWHVCEDSRKAFFGEDHELFA